jgi:hypothetical protein
MHCTMKTCRGEGTWQTFLTSALDGGEWSDSNPVALDSEKVPQYLSGRRLIGPQNWPGHCAEKELALTGSQIPVIQPRARWTS